MVILVDISNVVITVGNEVINDETETGVVWINGAGYGLTGQKVFEVDEIPAYVVPEKYKYINNEFVVNEEYSNPDEELEKLKAELQVAQENINMLIELQADMIGGAI